MFLSEQEIALSYDFYRFYYLRYTVLKERIIAEKSTRVIEAELKRIGILPDVYSRLNAASFDDKQLLNSSDIAIIMARKAYGKHKDKVLNREDFSFYCSAVLKEEVESRLNKHQSDMRLYETEIKTYQTITSKLLSINKSIRSSLLSQLIDEAYHCVAVDQEFENKCDKGLKRIKNIPQGLIIEEKMIILQQLGKSPESQIPIMAIRDCLHKLYDGLPNGVYDAMVHCELPVFLPFGKHKVLFTSDKFSESAMTLMKMESDMIEERILSVMSPEISAFLEQYDLN